MPALQPLRIIFLLDNRSDANWGSQATSAALLNGLQQTYPNATIATIPRTEIRVPKWAFSIGYRLAPKGALSDWKNPIGVLAERMLLRKWRPDIQAADLVVVNGEGTFHPQPQAAAWLSVIHRIASLQKCPVWIVNASFDMGDGSLDALLDSVMARVSRLVVREPASFRLAEDRGWTVEQGADCAFLLPEFSAALEEPSCRKWLEQNQINTPFAVVTGGANAGDWKAENLQSWIAALERRDLSIVLAASTSTDRQIFQLLQGKYPLFDSEEHGYRSYVSLVQTASVHLGGRFHPTIFAACQGTPYLCISGRTQKLQGLLEMLNSESCLFEPDDTIGILNAIEHLKITEKDENGIKHCNSLGVYAQHNFKPPA